MAVLGSLSQGYKHANAAEVMASYADDFLIKDQLARTAGQVTTEGGFRSTRAHAALDKAAYQEVLTAEFENIHVDGAKFVLDDIRKVGGGWEVDVWFNLYAEGFDGTRFHEDVRRVSGPERRSVLHDRANFAERSRANGRAKAPGRSSEGRLENVAQMALAAEAAVQRDHAQLQIRPDDPLEGGVQPSSREIRVDGRPNVLPEDPREVVCGHVHLTPEPRQ